MGEFAERLCGELFSKAPEPSADESTTGAEGTLDFGALGTLGEEPVGVPTRAQMLWDNADGVGPDARSWDAFWYDEAAAATATGYRWIYVETAPLPEGPEFRTPSGAPNERAESLARPYLVGFSPLDVPYWRESAGRLDAAVLKLSERRLSVAAGGGVEEEDVPVYHVLVRAGFTGFGDAMKGGGWWVVDEEGDVVVDEAGAERKGTWEKTGGMIPLTRLYYERPPKTGAKTTTGAPSGLRAGTYGLGAIAAELMDLGSVAFHDLWTSAKRQRFVPVRDAETAKALAERSSDPVVFVPMPEGGAFDVVDSGEISANGVLVAERQALTEQAYRFITRELATAPDASGRAKEVEHARGTSPRLASFARNVEEAQNFCLRMLELRWVAGSDGARATWTKRFDLESAAKALQPLVESMAASGLSSPTVWADYVLAALREVGAIPEGEEGAAKEQQIRAELSVGYERDRTFAGLGDLTIPPDLGNEHRQR